MTKPGGAGRRVARKCNVPFTDRFDESRYRPFGTIVTGTTGLVVKRTNPSDVYVSRTSLPAPFTGDNGRRTGVEQKKPLLRLKIGTRTSR